jgi:hypothetical protein
MKIEFYLLLAQLHFTSVDMQNRVHRSEVQVMSILGTPMLDVNIGQEQG